MSSSKISACKDKFSFPKEKWKTLHPLITWFQTQKGNSLFEQGAPGLGVYLLLEGEIEQYHLTPQGKKLIFELSGPGGIIGTETLFNKENHIATAEVVSNEAEVGFLERNNFFEVLEKNPSLLFIFAKRLSTKIMAYKLKHVEASYLGSKQRICRLLLAGTDCGLKLTRTKLAHLSGVSYKTTIQILGDLESRDLIETSEHKIEIVEEKGLQNLSNDFPLDLEEGGLL